MSVSPSAVRVKKSSGWQDIAIVGPPGPPGGEYELASAVGMADVTVPATSAATATTIITLPSVTFDGITTVILEFWSRAVGPPNNGANAYIALGFWQDGVQIGSNAPLVTIPAAGNMAVPFKMEARITPAAGARTFSVRAWVSANSGAYVSGGQNPGSAMFARVKRVMPPPPTLNTIAVPRCVLRSTGSNYSMTANQWNPIAWTVEHQDSDNMHDGTNPTRITFRTAGMYHIVGNGQIFGGVASNKSWRIQRSNGLTLAQSSITNVAANDHAQSLSAQEYFAVGDYVTFEHHPGAEGGSFTLGTLLNFSATMIEGIQGPPGPSTAIPLVSSLPASPVDGQEVYYLADATNGVIWHLRYRASSASAYKWEYIGGPPLSHEIPTDQATTSTSFADLGTPGPLVTVPLAGDYMVRAGFRAYSGSVNIAWAGSIKIGAAVATNSQYIAGHSGAVAFTGSHVTRTQRLNALAASTVLKLQYLVGAGTVDFVDRWMTVEPVRVG